jgi:hypothetical protein
VEKGAGSMNTKLVGHNILGFDLKYLHRSDLILEGNGHSLLNKGYWNDIFFDTMVYWQGGDRRDFVSLDAVAKALGHKEGKLGNGKHFHALSQEDKEAYLTQDLKVTEFVFNKMNKNEKFCSDPIIFDIETAPLSEEAVLDIIGPFDPDSVKLGARKKPEVIEAFIEEARNNYLSDAMDKAALDPRLSIPVAIGYIIKGEVTLDFNQPLDLVNRFWEIAGAAWSHNHQNKI